MPYRLWLEELDNSWLVDRIYLTYFGLVEYLYFIMAVK